MNFQNAAGECYSKIIKNIYKDKDNDKDKDAKKITETLTVCYIFGILMTQAFQVCGSLVYFYHALE